MNNSETKKKGITLRINVQMQNIIPQSVPEDHKILATGIHIIWYRG